LTNSENELILSDGSHSIFFLDEGLNVLRNITVYTPLAGGKNITHTNLNELEYVDGYIYANIWYTNNILVIDPATGVVKKLIDFTVLTQFEQNLAKIRGDVLNGIAYDKFTKSFYITGKKWSHIYNAKLKFNF
jgi:glutamine cyclotransferase